MWYRQGRDWHNYWATRSGWSGYSWYNTYQYDSTPGVDFGVGNWDFTNFVSGGPIYVWPHSYYVYVDPTIYHYYRWPTVYNLYGGPGLAYYYPALVGKVVIE
jgi:hypothetical protein